MDLSPEQQVPLSFDWSMDDWFFNQDLGLLNNQWGMPMSVMDSLPSVPAL